MAIRSANGQVTVPNGARADIVPFREGRVYLSVQNGNLTTGQTMNVKAPDTQTKGGGRRLDALDVLELQGRAAETGVVGQGTGGADVTCVFFEVWEE